MEPSKQYRRKDQSQQNSEASGASTPISEGKQQR